MAPPPWLPELGAFTVSVAELLTEPLPFEQVRVYEYVPAALGVSVVVPLEACAPDQLPEALQPLELIASQVKVAELPPVRVVGLIVRVGAFAGSPAKAAAT